MSIRGLDSYLFLALCPIPAQADPDVHTILVAGLIPFTSTDPILFTLGRDLKNVPMHRRRDDCFVSRRFPAMEARWRSIRNLVSAKYDLPALSARLCLWLPEPNPPISVLSAAHQKGDRNALLRSGIFSRCADCSVLGFGGIAGASASIAQVLFFLFVTVFIVSMVMQLVAGFKASSGNDGIRSAYPTPE